MALPTIDSIMANWNTPADLEETLAHFHAIYACYHSKQLSTWRTWSGKWIDVTVVNQLVEQGKVKYCPPAQVSPYLSGSYSLITS